MITADDILSKFDTEKTTAPSRLIAWGFALALLPFVPLTFFMSIFPPFLLLSIPGLALYGAYWRMALDKTDRDTSKAIWSLAIVYNGIFMITTLGLTQGVAWPLALFNLALIGFAYIARRDIMEEERGESRKERGETVAL